MPERNLPTSMLEIAITQPGGPEVLLPRRANVPIPAPDELLIKVAAAGVNRPDVLQRRGSYPVPSGASPIPGLEIAGDIVALGNNVRGFSLGEAVCGLTSGGGYAEYCVLPARQALPCPPNLDMIRAAAIPEIFFTVWANLFMMGRARAGEIALIHGGASGIGTTALMLCREFGIRALATAGSPVKCEAISALGATAINYRDLDFAEVVARETEGRGVDVILDIVGGPYFSRNIASLARDGRLVVIGLLGGNVAPPWDLQGLMSKRALVTGSTLRARTPEEKAQIADALRETVWPVIGAGRCWPIIDAVFPLADAAAAHRAMEANQHIGKIVLSVSG